MNDLSALHYFDCLLQKIWYTIKVGFDPQEDVSIKRILGIDPGTAIVGFGIIEALGGDAYKYISSGTIQTPKTMNAGQRLSMIRRDMFSILEEYRPEEVSIEAIFFFKNAKTLVPVSQARGVIVESVSTFGLPYFEYTPMQAKMCLTGFGRADKKLVQEAVANVLNLTEIIKPDDASDALAMAISHLRMVPSSSLLPSV